MNSESPLYISLRFDKGDSLRTYLVGIDDINITLHITDSSPMLSDDPPLISIACFFGSDNCFNYLKLIGCDMNKADKQGVLFIYKIFFPFLYFFSNFLIENQFTLLLLLLHQQSFKTLMTSLTPKVNLITKTTHQCITARSLDE